MDRPKDLPNRLECAYCRRSRRHGGECQEKSLNKNEDGCLYFDMDKRGCIRNSTLEIPFPLYKNIPPLNAWDDSWTMCGIETEIRIREILGLRWNTKEGTLIVTANCDYYVNDLSEKYKRENSKPKLQVIKGDKSNE
nr:hypothetical protein [Clostridium neonatale]